MAWHALEITSDKTRGTDSLVPGRWRTDSPKALPASFSSLLCRPKERNEAIKIQSDFAPVMRFSPVIIVIIILSLLLFVAFGTWFSPRSARVAVWHIAAVRILRRRRLPSLLPLRRGRSHSLKRERRRSQMMRLTCVLSIIDREFRVVIDRSIDKFDNPTSIIFTSVVSLCGCCRCGASCCD